MFYIFAITLKLQNTSIKQVQPLILCWDILNAYLFAKVPIIQIYLEICNTLNILNPNIYGNNFYSLSILVRSVSKLYVYVYVQVCIFVPHMTIKKHINLFKTHTLFNKRLNS